ncbi:Protein of unknown function [Rhizobium tibeticum]|uniref:DUF982 domain-containing protein n=1 Tax=Rhizobium tibeticum TaxID=501024 RepID=A0A1H8MI38_9HYPH|nr:DUF982 domain-containing protein [Rhizobium tibeticum]SEH91868.1 hypothetical protein RTCCBAU85039_3056 [Rhizobium tibeticum]SEO16963.1 Protein of unknown function [Rhizobium tibeticum]
MPTPDVLWNTPVNVRLQNGAEKSFESIHDTLDFLENEWPKARGAYHDAAVISCRNALRRQTPPAVSKELFLAACLEAGLAVRGGKRRSNGERFSPTVHRHF